MQIQGNTRTNMRILHRYLGFFMAGIMTIYAISGMLLVYRDTDFLKKEKFYEKVIAKNLDEKQLKDELKIKNLSVDKVENGIFFFKEGTYNASTGQAKYSKMELPTLLDKMTSLHKSPSKGSLGGVNILFGLCLLFFVISSFWMFTPKSKIFQKGIKFAVAGFLIALLLLFL